MDGIRQFDRELCSETSGNGQYIPVNRQHGKIGSPVQKQEIGFDRNSVSVCKRFDEAFRKRQLARQGLNSCVINSTDQLCLSLDDLCRCFNNRDHNIGVKIVARVRGHLSAFPLFAQVFYIVVNLGLGAAWLASANE